MDELELKDVIHSGELKPILRQELQTELQNFADFVLSTLSNMYTVPLSFDFGAMTEDDLLFRPFFLKTRAFLAICYPGRKTLLKPWEIKALEFCLSSLITVLGERKRWNGYYYPYRITQKGMYFYIHRIENNGVSAEDIFPDGVYEPVYIIQESYLSKYVEEEQRYTDKQIDVFQEGDNMKDLLHDRGLKGKRPSTPPDQEDLLTNWGKEKELLSKLEKERETDSDSSLELKINELKQVIDPDYWKICGDE